MLPAADGTPGKGGCSHGREDEQPPWTREQPVLPAEVVAPIPLSMGAAISVGGEAQIGQLGVKIVFPHPPLGIIMRN